MSRGTNDVGGHSAPHVVSSIEDLHEIVRVVSEVGAFAFDVETMGVVERHPDVLAWIEKECKSHTETLKLKTDDIIARAKETIINRWRDTLALDPLRNNVFWLGIATEGRSWAIPMGHPNGEVLVPEERGDGTTVPPSWL